MRNHLRTPFAILLLIGALASPAAADKQFNAGALIIPPSAAYQTNCGAVAIYGLVYDVLRANAYIAAHPLLFPNGPIEIYYTYRDNKSSPNRCIPTNKSSLPPAPTADPKWLDGCDFDVYNNTVTPVKRVNNAAPAVINDVDIVTTDTTGVPEVHPGYASETINFTIGGHNRVRYLGGPFIIDDADAPYFLDILAGTTTVWDDAAGAGNVIDFAPFRTAATCAFGTTTGGYVNIHRSAGIFFAPAAKAFVTAPPRVALLATLSPGVSAVDVSYPTVAIAKKSSSGATEVGTTVTIKTKSNHGLLVGDRVAISGLNPAGYNGTWTVTAVNAPAKTFTYTAVASGMGNSGSGTVTKSPGITKVGSIISITSNGNHGLAPGDMVSIVSVSVPGYNGIWQVTTTPTASTLTIDTSLAPNVDPGVLATSFAGGTMTKQGGAATTRSVSDGILQKYLKLAGLSFPGAAGCPPGGLNVGNPIKCPLGPVHGQIYDTFDFADIAAGLLDSNYKMIWTPHWETTSTNASQPSAGELLAVSKIGTFLDGQTGLMAECHSIESFEGAYKNGATDQQGNTVGQFQTCHSVAGVCSGTTTFGINKDVPDPGSGYHPNCTDPDQVNTNKCIFYGAPGDPFVQPGDFEWNPIGGSVQNYVVNSATQAIYKPGVLPLVSGVNSLDTTKTAPVATARASIVSTDYVSRSQKDNDSAKGNILYMSGHDVSGSVSGTKVILQSLLLLGEPPIVPVTTEVTRSSPITSIINAQTALVQGTFEKVVPAGATSFTNDDSTVAAFRFPDVIGHMRAIPVANVGTSQKGLSDVTLSPIFDAADQLPPTTSSYAGCGANAFGASGGGCRTIFTHTATGANPARIVLDSAQAANATLLGLFNSSGGTLTTVGLPTLIQRIIAGTEFPVGTFIPKLGGVDRSTVAVVPSSLVAGVARPTVIYFGATDGMLHAVCGSVSVGTGCDVLGRELWGFIPRLQLGNIRKNRARIDGSPRVMDLYGDFSGSGTRGFHTILMFQTGSGDPATAGLMPSVTALDITNPFDPKIVWDFALANAGARGTFEAGQGLVLSAGPVRIGGVFKNLAFIQTNNGGTSGIGNVVTAVNMEDASVKWTHTINYPIAAIGRAMGAPPSTAIPGGAVGVDKAGTGAITDVVFGTLYGELWQVDAATGNSREGGGNPGTVLFRYTADQHPIGASPTIYSNGGALFAVGVPGGYADLSTSTTLWSAASQTAVAVSLSVPAASAPLDEGTVPAAGSSAPNGAYIPWEFTFQNGDKAFAQAVVVGGQIFITTDTLDVNDPSNTGYGTAAFNTGRVYQLSVTDGTAANTVVVRGGAGSVNTDGTAVYIESKDKVQRLADSGAMGGTGTGGGAAIDAASTTGESPGTLATPKITRLLWLRTL